MQKRLLVANWKQNGSSSFIDDYFFKISSNFSDFFKTPLFNFVVCPPAVYLQNLAISLKKWNCGEVSIGAQTVSSFKQGAYTGEVSAEMLRDVGCHYVLIGHSERRQLFHETDAVLAEKYHLAIEAGLQPIFCVGETAAERKSGSALNAVFRQLDMVFSDQIKQKLPCCYIAYEPVWAIGSKTPASLDDIAQMHAAILSHLGKKNNFPSDFFRVLYGGSVQASNASDILSINTVSGLLIGSASLSPEQMTSIAKLMVSTAPETA